MPSDRCENSTKQIVFIFSWSFKILFVVSRSENNFQFHSRRYSRIVSLSHWQISSSRCQINLKTLWRHFNQGHTVSSRCSTYYLCSVLFEFLLVYTLLFLSFADIFSGSVISTSRIERTTLSMGREWERKSTSIDIGFQLLKEHLFHSTEQAVLTKTDSRYLIDTPTRTAERQAEREERERGLLANKFVITSTPILHWLNVILIHSSSSHSFTWLFFTSKAIRLLVFIVEKCAVVSTLISCFPAPKQQQRRWLVELQLEVQFDAARQFDSQTNGWISRQARSPNRH